MAAGNLLPSDLPAPPILRQGQPADARSLTLALILENACR